MMVYLPARGGSKRIPRKNMRVLGDKPVIVHVIETLKRLPFIDNICVSTDDPEIAQLSKAHGAITLDPRSADLASDTATLVDLIRHDLGRFLEHCSHRSNSDTVLVVLPTAALLSPEVLQDAFEQFNRSGGDLLCATTSYSVSPFRALVETDDGNWKPLHADMLMTRSQDLPEARVDVGMFYFMNSSAVAKHPGHWFTLPGGIQCYLVPPTMACDVDTPEDWDRLERLFCKLQGSKKR